MKQFRKTQEGLFICEECGKICKSLLGLCPHISKNHNKREYFDKWLKEEKDGKCKMCDKETVFISISLGYKNCCCSQCKNKYTQIQTEKGCIKKYGCNSAFGVKSVQEKTKQTLKNLYGVEHCSQLESSKKCIGEKNKLCAKESLQKRNQTNKERYGHENFAHGINEQKVKNTLSERYGVENPAQIPEVYEKGLKTRFLIHQYKNTNIWYQGSYELDFLEKYYDLFPTIQRGFSIKYLYNGKNKVYHSDFYIPSLNLIIEIKSSWTIKLDLEITAKKTAVINYNYNYILIINKNYDEFNKLLQ